MNVKRLTILCAGLGICLVPWLSSAQQPAADEPALAAKARNILQQHCFDCHGKDPAKLRGQLNVFDAKHLFDKERKIVVPKAPDQSDLIQQVDKGTMPPGKRPKVPEAERKILRDWVAAGAPGFVKVPAPQPPPTPSPDQLAARAKEIFRAHCFDCHGGTRTSAGVRILDQALLLKKKKLVPGKPEESLLLQLVTATDDSVMPPQGQPRLVAADIDAIRQWIQHGAAPFPADVTPPAEPAKDKVLANITGVNYVLKKILEHVGSLPAKDRTFARYFSINHVLSAGATADELETQRQALAKAINHLSWQRQLVTPAVVDAPVGSIFHVDIRELGWDLQPFEIIQDGRPAGASKLNLFDLALLEYPYAVFYESSDTYDQLLQQYLIPAGLVRPIPYVRADWFVSVMTLPPLYEDMLRLPFVIDHLEARLEVQAQANLDNGKALRAGMTVSGVSRNNRVVERHPTGYGAYWKSHDFRTSKGVENIFRSPLHFQPSGGEMIFNLPNGLQGYYVSDNRGNRLSSAPTEIVTDKFAEDKTVRNGLSCIRCHDAGIKTFHDDVRPALEGLPANVGVDKRLALQIYAPQADMDRLVQQDAQRFQDAMQKLLGKAPAREPLTPVSQRFLDGPLQMSSVAGELGLTDHKLLQQAVQLPQFAGLGLSALAVEGGVIRRDMWEDYYDRVVRHLGLGLPIVPLDGLTRLDYTPLGDFVDLKTNKPGNLFRPGDEAVIKVVNRSARDIYVELVVTDVHGFKVVLVPATTVVKAGQEYATAPIKIQPQLGKEQITLFASPVRFAPGYILRVPKKEYDAGRIVVDRYVHPFYQVERNGQGFKLAYDPGRIAKKTIDIETR
jgi:mono/diheme cytochrome c family protein/cytochrome c553